MKTQEAKDQLLARGTIDVKGECFKIKPADRRDFVGHVHWAPVFIVNEDIQAVLCPFAVVEAMKHELYTDAGLEGVATGVRTVVLYGDRRQVPHIIQVVDPDTAEVWNCLVTIPAPSPNVFAVQGGGTCYTRTRRRRLQPPPLLGELQANVNNGRQRRHRRHRLRHRLRRLLTTA